MDTLKKRLAEEGWAQGCGSKYQDGGYKEECPDAEIPSAPDLLRPPPIPSNQSESRPGTTPMPDSQRDVFEGSVRSKAIGEATYHMFFPVGSLVRIFIG